MAYCSGQEATNLRNRYKGRLIKKKLDGKDPLTGFRWLPPQGSLLHGELKKKQGAKPQPLFTIVGELLPRSAWGDLPGTISGIYILFDSSETARYIGLSNDVKERLRRYFNDSDAADDDKREVATAFSVYGVSSRKRARELESMLIHAFGPQLFLNQHKHRHFGKKPDYKVFEPGTLLLKRRTKMVGVRAMLEHIK